MGLERVVTTFFLIIFLQGVPYEVHGFASAKDCGDAGALAHVSRADLTWICQPEARWSPSVLVERGRDL